MKTKVQTLAEKFLTLADELNEKVSNYFNGSNAPEDVKAYRDVKESYKEFAIEAGRLHGENYGEELNYELAESFIC